MGENKMTDKFKQNQEVWFEPSDTRETCRFKTLERN